MTQVEAVERTVNSFVRRWLGVPPSFTSIGLYSKTAQLQLPLSSVIEEFKVAKCRTVMTLRDSQDQKVRDAGIQTRSGRKWSASTAVKQAESILEIKDMIGNTCTGREGIGMSHFHQWNKADKGERRNMVQEEVRREEEEARRSRAVQLGKQGAWTKWELPQRKITWTELWRMDQFRVSFLLRSVYDTLPSPANLQCWGLVQDPSCKLCGKTGTMVHILSGCGVALRQGRYRWRHDRVLGKLAEIVEKERVKKRPKKKTPGMIAFVKEGMRPAVNSSKQKQSVLDTGNDWELRVDLNRKLVFPDIVVTTLRPDMVLWSKQVKTLIAVELTVPWEENCDVAHERKSLKYSELMSECREKGWRVLLLPVEVGCRGFPAQSVWKLMTTLGMVSSARKTAVRQLAEVAEKSSCWVWHRRDELNWTPGASSGLATTADQPTGGCYG